MKIEIDTTSMTEIEARALNTLLCTVFPKWFGDVPRDAAGDVDLKDVPRDAAGDVDLKDVDLKDVPRDAAGISWDARIHTSNQATKQDGTWKRKPGLDDAFYCGVMVELTETAALPEPEAIETNAETAFAPPPPPPPPPAPPASEGGPAPDTFLSNVELATTLRIGGEQLRAALAEAGLEGMAALASADEETQSKVAGLLRAAGAAQ